MHQGIYRLGDEFRLDFLCRINVPGFRVAEPDSAPSVDIYGPDNKPVKGALVAPLDRQAALGLFSYSVFLGPAFSEGQHRVMFRYVVGGFPAARMSAFQILGGGDPSGHVVALYNYRRPHANFLIQQRSNGGVYKGQNPREDV